MQTVRLAFFRNVFSMRMRQNHTPGSNLGFHLSAYAGHSTRDVPYLIVSGYAAVGNPITGPQNTYQNDYQGILLARHDARPP